MVNAIDPFNNALTSSRTFCHIF